MNTTTTVQPDPLPHSQVVARVTTPTRAMFWSVRRELWENRSVYVAPVVVAVVVLFASLVGSIGLPAKFRALASLDPVQRQGLTVRPFSMAPAPIMLTTILVGLLYSLDALYGERRDRSILFWKSLPVSDLTAVLSKASIPLVVLPLIGFVLSVATVATILLVSTAVLLANGLNPELLWAKVRVFEEPAIMLYGLTVHALWFAPLYGWLLLMSAWARRAPLLWAALPPLALIAVEKMAINTLHFGTLLRYRVTGAMEEAFAVDPNGRVSGNIERLSQLTPATFLSTPGLWLGLVFAAACLVVAVRLRRDRDPI